MKKIKSVRESSHFKQMAKVLKMLTGANLTIAMYNEMISK